MVVYSSQLRHSFVVLSAIGASAPHDGSWQREDKLRKKSILLDIKDNVATALTPLSEGESVSASLDHVSYDVDLLEDIQFEHKFALMDIATGEDVLKFGMPIGQALEDIRTGQWVHVHNCRSKRFGFHREQYGLKA